MKGRITYEIYRSTSNQYCVLKFKGESKAITITGYNLPSPSNFTYEIQGNETDGKYGKQFNVTSCEVVIENNRAGVISYLSSGLIKGIGKVTAERIYNRFGADTLDIIANEPLRLLEVKGMNKAKVTKVSDSYKENHLPKNVVELLTAYSFPMPVIIKICKYIPGDIYSEIISDPYILCKIRGVSFRMADMLRDKCGINDTDQSRVFCAIAETIKYNYICGSVGITLQDLMRGTMQLTGLRDASEILKQIHTAVTLDVITYRKVKWGNKVYQYFYTKAVKEAEDNLSREIKRCLSYKKDESKKAEQLLEKHTDGFIPDKSQKEAILGAFKNGLSIITGGPGTGKTTTIKRIAEIDKELHPKAGQIFLAPTGRAAKRITESSGFAASTIHKQFCLMPKEDENDTEFVSGMNDGCVIENELVIIDEFSMVDMTLALCLFENLHNCRIVIVGDPDQLPSVSAGNVLKDMISSGVIPVTHLVYEHRQDEGSAICDNAHAMQSGCSELVSGNGFDCKFDLSMQEIEDNMVNQYVECIKSGNYKSAVVLCPYKKYTAGLYAVNARIQNILNPLSGRNEVKGREGMVFREGDPVMHIKKNTDTVVNGDVGVVAKIYKDGKDMVVFAKFESPDGCIEKEYTQSDIDQLILAYAMTVHKSQGSEYDAVIFGLSQFHSKMLKRNIIYTAITRAKKQVFGYFDSKNTVKCAIENNSTDERNTLLTYLLQHDISQPVSPEKHDEKKKEKGSIQVIGQMVLSCVASM